MKTFCGHNTEIIKTLTLDTSTEKIGPSRDSKKLFPPKKKLQ